jgi:hypothetical protein
VSATLADDFVMQHQERYLIDPSPRVIPFKVSCPDQYEVTCLPAPGLSLLLIEEEQAKAGVVAIAMDEEMGLYIAMGADHLRALAAGMLTLANGLDGGAGKQ